MQVVAGVADPGYCCSKGAKTKLTESNHMKRAIKIETASFLTRRHHLQVLFTLGVLAFCQGAHAVVPAPDGGYPGFNTAEGQNALFSRTTGMYNTALGGFSLYSDTTGRANTAVGLNAMRFNVTGEFNTAVGVNALYFNDGDPAIHRASDNSAFGAYALFANSTGNANTATGYQALLSNTNGTQSTANGAFALFSNTTGTSNTAIGYAALNENTTGNFNVALGNSAGLLASGSRNVYIGSGMEGVPGESNACYIASIFGQTSANGIPVLVNSDNKLGTATSSKRFKEEIKPMGQASDALLALKPVSFRYKKEIDPKGTAQFGLVAEEVEKVNPDLVVRDKEGKPYSVRYDQVNAMLLNEFLKAHRKIEEQQKQIDALTAQLKQQTAKIQKVTAQIKLKGRAPQIVLSSR
jgi:hypothetical protein